MPMDMKLLDYIADADLGVYPKSIDGDNGYTERSDWQNGWNHYVCDGPTRPSSDKYSDEYIKGFSAACEEYGDRIDTVKNWLEYNLLPVPGYHLLLEMLGEDELFLFKCEKNKYTLAINYSDTFYYACSHTESLDRGHYALLANVYHSFGRDGINAYGSVMRGDDVIPPHINAKYEQAKRFIKKLLNYKD
jgi:hypothetical protein